MLVEKENRFRKIACCGGAAAIILVLFPVYLLTIEPRPRIFYSPFSFDTYRSEIFRDYEEKRRAGAPWTRNAQTVALRLNGNCASEAGPPLNDCSTPTKIDVFPSAENRVTFIILEDPVLGDDSIAAEETRLELVRAGDGAWDVGWAGVRWRCDEERSGFSGWSRFTRCS